MLDPIVPVGPAQGATAALPVTRRPAVAVMLLTLLALLAASCGQTGAVEANGRSGSQRIDVARRFDTSFRDRTRAARHGTQIDRRGSARPDSPSETTAPGVPTTATATAGDPGETVAEGTDGTTAGATPASATETAAAEATGGVVETMTVDPAERPFTPAPPGAPTTTTTRPPTTTTTTRPPTTTTTRPPTTTTRPPTTTTTRPPTGGRFETLPPGASLPSGDECARLVRAAPEIRADNAGYNSTRGTGSNGRYPRVDGNFTGTTDEIIQWAACKWGIDEDIARAQAAKESWWHMSAGGDLSSNQSNCHPSLRTSNGQPCPESIGLLQVRYLYHLEAFENSNAIRSTAYNIDYTFANWRACFEGELTWLNNVERGAEYRAGDLDGCLGVWFTGRWYVPEAYPYIQAVHDLANERVWEQAYFING